MQCFSEILNIKLPDDLKLLKGTLTRPNKKSEPIDITEGPDNTVSLNFTPYELGIHVADVMKRDDITRGDKPIKDSPFKIMVVDTLRHKSKCKPAEEEPATVGNPCHVCLDAPDVDIPDDLPVLSGVLSRPSGKEEPIGVKEGPSKTLSVDFVPKEPGEHLVDIKKRRRPIENSPYKVMVEEPTEQGPEVGKPFEASLPAKGLNLPRDLPELCGTLERPDGTEEPVDVKAGPNDTLLVNFTSKEPGKYFIHIKKGRIPIDGSPFEIIVLPASKKEPKALKVGSPTEVAIPAKELNLPKDPADFRGTLERSDGKEEPINVKAGPNDTIEGNPSEIIVEPLPQVGKQCKISISAEGLTLPLDLPDLEGILERPNAMEEPLDLLVSPDNNSFPVTFIPNEPGKHLVHIKMRGKPINGSPFEVIVQVVALTVGSSCNLNLKAEGLDLPLDLLKLKAVLERPDGTEDPLDVQACRNNISLTVSFTPKEHGRHLIHIKKEGTPIKRSPFEVIVDPRYDNPVKIGLEIPGIKFPDDLKLLNASLTMPSGTEEPCELSAGPKERMIVASFLPKGAGKHKLNVKKGGKHVRQSPYKIITFGEGEFIFFSFLHNFITE